ncbi:Manganese-dependent 2,3-dihydroxybiphenyl 1,2-dioxygenase [Serratia quinivorans]|uniref:VOC family protein n=1 Tax=Serratia quinivorans TaxID=137545 RepID=UPI00217957ED|nr:VOC family protein [Serratia quinivorans]CAI1605682.1 Manganese-dependent 2,3-dihydroxybiphenyl 1,2-dioxygenase [Serratia quinivorans]
MTSKWIEALRSVALDVPDLHIAEDFYTRVWNLTVAAHTNEAIYLRGAGSDHHLLALHKADNLAIRNFTLRARNVEALSQIKDAALLSGGQVVQDIAPVDEPGGGIALTIFDPHGRIIRIVHGDQRQMESSNDPDRPIRLAHVVLNSHSVTDCQNFFETVLDFHLSDRTRIMAFLNCDHDHHSIALGDADNNALNHIAFLMPDLDAVMRGGGRMRDAQHPIEWGPGRHGPGNNAFNYFIGPFGEVIEYTAEVEQITDSYPVGSPSEWTWPKGRTDQWGISQSPSAALKVAQRSVFFIKI